jgi:hypothetical protein
VRFQKRLLTGMRIRPVIRPVAGHAAQAKHVHLLLFAVNLGIRFS